MIRLRPHHGMCLYFFKGKGYSGNFVRNMTEYKELLEKEDPLITLTQGVDDICAKCPNNRSGVCTSIDKVNSYDAQVLKICGLKSETTMRYKNFSREVYETILITGKREKLCGNCRWNDLCFLPSGPDPADT